MTRLPIQRLHTRSRTVWTVLVCGALLPTLLCAVLGSYVLMRSHAQHERQAELNSQNLATAIERSVASEVEKIDVILSAVASVLEMQLQGGPLDLHVMQQLLEAQSSLRPEFEGVRVTNEKGIAILGPEIQGRGPFDFSDREWFLAQRNHTGSRLFMSHPLVSRVTGKQILSFSRQYRFPDGRFAGAVTAAMPLAYFSNHLVGVDLGSQGVVILRHTDLSLIGRYPSFPADLREEIGRQGGSPELRAFVQTGLSTSTFHPSVTRDGIARLSSVRRLSKVPLVVLVGLGTADYMASWEAERRAVLAGCAGVIGVCGLGTWLLLRAMAENQASRQRVDLLARAFEHSGEAIAVMDADGRILEVNPALCQRLGFAPEQLIGQDGQSLLLPTCPPEQLAQIRDRLQTDGMFRCELTERTRNGQDRTTWVTFTALRDGSDAVTHLITNSIDLTELKQAEARIRHLALHDGLTQLPNREKLAARFGQAATEARRKGSEMAMLFIDMDRFKTINDTLGHAVGDQLLIEVGHRLRSLVPEHDIVARVGGDEFVVVLTDAGPEAQQASTHLATRLVTALGQTYEINGHQLHSTPSIGISVFPVDGQDVDTLMKCADTAMYSAKSAGRNSFQFFTPDMKQDGAQRMAIENGLRTAVERGQLRLHYQPQVELGSGRIVGLEALVRWQHPELGLVPPLAFIPVAEETGQIEDIGRWVLEEALAQVAEWRRIFSEPLRVAVNVSALQFGRSDFVQRIAGLLARHALPGDALELEITETTAMQAPARTAATLRDLRALGVALALDDFGTGYSSMTYLKAFPLSSLKLDRSFVQDLEHDANDAAICKATIQLSQSLGLSVIAEGVETPAQLAFLRALGCDLMQGYLFSKPLAAEACEQALRQRWLNVTPEVV